MKRLILVALAAVSLTACGGRVATVTVDPGYNGAAPSVDCHAVLNNPDYHPTTTSAKP